jgi:hypothetical protein
LQHWRQRRRARRPDELPALDAGADTGVSLDATSDVPGWTDAAQVPVGAPDATVDLSGGSPDLLAPTCGQAAFPAVDRRCTTGADCIVVRHQTDCCGSQIALGIRADQRDRFEANERAPDGLSLQPSLRRRR